jgi:vacuolar protein-sorting-associated protein 4
MDGAIVFEKPDLKFTDVAGLSSAKQALNEAVIMPLRVPHLFEGPTSPWRGILLYGPPGTGKSFLAKALAGEAGACTFLTVSSSDIVSKWVGESEKLVRSLFETARQRKPAIIFIDEIDSLVSTRDESGSSHENRMKTEFLVQLDGMKYDNTGVLLIAATNLPWNIDPAMRRRFEKRIYIPLPDRPARKSLVLRKLQEANHNLTTKQINTIVVRTDGYSSADVSVLIRDALMESIRDVQKSKFFKMQKDKDGKEKWVVCGSADPAAEKKVWTELPPEQIAVPVATMAHFEKSLGKVKPSVGPGDLKKYEQWTQEFGEEGR